MTSHCCSCGKPAHDQCDPCKDMASWRATTLGEKLDRALDDNQRLRDALERTSGFLKEHEMALEYWEDRAKNALSAMEQIRISIADNAHLKDKYDMVLRFVDSVAMAALAVSSNK